MKARTYRFQNVGVASGAAVVGKLEGQGPLRENFDLVLPDDKWGEKSFEKAERKMFREALRRAMQKNGWQEDDVDVIVGGDLLNQIISASFASENFPFLGVYGACSTICESMLIGASLIENRFASHVLCAASSHFSSVERQYRFPLEYGSQPTPTTQWTVTGAGCTALTDEDVPVRLLHATMGRIIDPGLRDTANMGAAMAPAAADTLCAFFRDTGTRPTDYDLILTGDLGKLGKELLLGLMKDEGYELYPRYNDCGCMIFYPDQTSSMGGSGCGCAASVFGGAVLRELQSGKLKNVVLAATGAMLSPTSAFQGENVPGICYAVHFGRQE